ncbi:ABC-2 type transport system ATP-binding protein [Bacillus fengqiuensis]|nr:ABC-2 type transport system ATP-binding protein [Bacillus fengqiuensis]
MIEIKGLTKQFSNGKGIFDVSFSVSPGEVVGFLGPNGAGKSTTIRHLMGFMKPSKGNAAIFGLDTWSHAADIQKRVGYLPGEISFLDGMNGIEFLKLLGGMRKMNDETYRNELIDRLQFDAATPIRKMSKGMKQKVGITAAFMHRPDVLILDEPTSGLDPLMQQTFLDLVIEEKARGAAILMSSHSFMEVERACDRVVMIKDGRIAADEKIDELQTKQRKVFDLALENEEDIQKLLASIYETERVGSNRVRVTVQGDYSSFFSLLSTLHIMNVTVHAQNLEDLFMNFYDRGGRP